MVAHRKNVPAPRAYVPSTWFVVLSVMLVVGAGGWLGWLIVGDGSSPSEAAAPTAASTKPPVTTPVPSATPSTPAPESSSEPAPDETADSPEATDEPATRRTAPVSVLNNSGVVGAARTFSAKVAGAGWAVSGIGNWSGSIPANTVYYPPSLQSQAQLLAADVGIERVRPSVSPMRTDRLTIILSGAQ